MRYAIMVFIILMVGYLHCVVSYSDSLLKAAMSGNSTAQCEVGRCYASGEGVNKDFQEAVKWFRMAAEQNDKQAQFNLGACYAFGHGVTQNNNEAVKWYRLAAEKGSAEAQSNLGWCFINGTGVVKDFTEAARLFKLAAEQGFAEAQNNLGECYLNGTGVAKNLTEAAKWYRLSAEQECSEAQNSLGKCYYYGYGVTMDIIEAYFWFSIASSNGSKIAEDNKGDLEKNNLTKQQIDEVKARVTRRIVSTPEKASEGFVFVRGGVFKMGISNPDNRDDPASPAHNVNLSDFYISTHEVTQGEWQAVMGNNPAEGFGVGDNYPVYSVCWYDVIEFCNKKSISDGLVPAYIINGTTNPADWGVPDKNWESATFNILANGYRLPTEAEWEYAALGGNKSIGYVYSGSNSLDSVAWYYDNSSLTNHKVMGKKANELGIFDMTGNVWEWTWDWRDWYGSQDQDNPTGPMSSSYPSRIRRGGSCFSDAFNCLVTTRDFWDPKIRFNKLGFRLCRTAK